MDGWQALHESLGRPLLTVSHPVRPPAWPHRNLLSPPLSAHPDTSHNGICTKPSGSTGVIRGCPGVLAVLALLALRSRAMCYGSWAVAYADTVLQRQQHPNAETMPALSLLLSRTVLYRCRAKYTSTASFSPPRHVNPSTMASRWHQIVQ